MKRSAQIPDSKERSEATSSAYQAEVMESNFVAASRNSLPTRPLIAKALNGMTKPAEICRNIQAERTADGHASTLTQH
jgi:hypothetical protein